MGEKAHQQRRRLGKCSSDRIIAAYGANIWNVPLCPVP
jgi:hypothetical protein